MAPDLRRLAAYVGGAVALALLAVFVAGPALALQLNPWWALIAAPAVAVLAWMLSGGLNPADATPWPAPLTAVTLTGEVHELGVTQTMAMLQSADRGSALSVDDVARVLTDVTARQLVRSGADPHAPFAHAEARLSRGLWRYLSDYRDGGRAAKLSPRRLDDYLKEIGSL